MTVIEHLYYGGGGRIALVKPQFGYVYQSQSTTLQYKDLLVIFFTSANYTHVPTVTGMVHSGILRLISNFFYFS